jgi:4-hydroxythreonine-4-phosphate dehydrogenase
MATLRLAITPGEPAGIGPDLLLQIAQHPLQHELVVIADRCLLQERAELLKLPIALRTFDPELPPRTPVAGELLVLAEPLVAACTPGLLDSANASYVLNTLNRAVKGCQSGMFDAMVTAPVNKAAINDSGFAFSGHTEYLAAATQTPQVVMMLATEHMRVALVTTHLPLSDVPSAITASHLDAVIRIVDQEMRSKYGLAQPCLAVLGLNPHAGEAGHLGREEIEIIEPTLEKLRDEGLDLIGPLPADTAYNKNILAQADVVVAMYHDQGLPVLKYSGFGEAVNITLGLPLIRTSVDHGTALELAGTGNADAGSLLYAISTAADMALARAASHAGATHG